MRRRGFSTRPGWRWSGLPRLMAVIEERPSGLALARALAAGAFRIGGSGPAPEAGGFETLTSGSSGTPRRIRRSFQSWTLSFAVNAGLYGIGPGVRVAVLGRLTQSLALYGAVEAVHLGAELHLLDELRPDRQRRELARRGVQVLYATPAQMRLLVEAGGEDLAALRHLLIGGSKLDMGLRGAIMAAWHRGWRCMSSMARRRRVSSLWRMLGARRSRSGGPIRGWSYGLWTARFG